MCVLPFCHSPSVREWSCNDVRTWLKQLNPGLHSLYSTNFATHDVTGTAECNGDDDECGWGDVG